MTEAQMRQIIRNNAKEAGARYRITIDGEVHYYGQMPNSNETGWYFVACSPAQAVNEITYADRMEETRIDLDRA